MGMGFIYIDRKNARNINRYRVFLWRWMVKVCPDVLAVADSMRLYATWRRFSYLCQKCSRIWLRVYSVDMPIVYDVAFHFKSKARKDRTMADQSIYQKNQRDSVFG